MCSVSGATTIPRATSARHELGRERPRRRSASRRCRGAARRSSGSRRAGARRACGRSGSARRGGRGRRAGPSASSSASQSRWPRYGARSVACAPPGSARTSRPRARRRSARRRVAARRPSGRSAVAGCRASRGAGAARAVGAAGRQRGGEGLRGVDDEHVAGAQVVGEVAGARVPDPRAVRVARCSPPWPRRPRPRLRHEHAHLVAAQPARLGRLVRLARSRATRREHRSRSRCAHRGVLRPQRHRELGRAVAAARQVALDEREQAGHAVARRRAVGDVLARERVLVHARVHVAGVDGVDAQVGALGGEHVGELLERRLRRAVAAPALVALDRGVGGDVDDPPAGGHARQRELDERERRDRVDGEDVLERRERVVGERGQRRRAERARVVDEQVERLARGFDEPRAVLGVGDVAGDRDDVRGGGELRAGRFELVRAAGVEDEPPAALGERAGELEAETSRGAGDDGCLVHGATLRAHPPGAPSAIGPRTVVAATARGRIAARTCAGWDVACGRHAIATRRQRCCSTALDTRAGVPCWIDTSQPDPAAAARFYGELFGWELEDRMPAGADGHYFMAALDGPRSRASARSTRAPPRGTRTSRCTAPTRGGEGAARRRRASSSSRRSRRCGAHRGARRPVGRGGRALGGPPAQGRRARERAGTWNWSNLETPDLAAREGLLRRGLRLGVRRHALRRQRLGHGAPARLRRTLLGEHDPEIRRRHAEAGAPSGFSDAVGWLHAERGPAPRGA